MDRNDAMQIVIVIVNTSLSARRAWIEIVEFHLYASSGVVALRKESVDRNDAMQIIIVVMNVALRKESVDRNKQGRNGQNIKRRSLSARRAWIEISVPSSTVIVIFRRSPQGERG